MTTDWPRYRSHKIVRALPIVAVADEKRPNGERVLMVELRGQRISFSPSEAAMARHAEVGWYAVVYEDGWRSVSPPHVFQQGYSPA